MQELPLEGEIDMANAPQLEAGLTRSIADGYDDLVLECSALSFIDSSGLAVLVRAQDALQASGRKLVLRNLSRSCRTAFEVTGLDQVLVIE